MGELLRIHLSLWNVLGRKNPLRKASDEIQLDIPLALSQLLNRTLLGHVLPTFHRQWRTIFLHHYQIF